MRNRLITIFVIVWLLVFHYESLRAFYLNPLFGTALPKLKFLFPPAGWIMFYNVDENEVRAEVYGQKNGALEKINPHRIFNNRWLGYDNTRRNVLVSVLDPSNQKDFCPYLRRKFPEYERFAVVAAIYPSNLKYPGKKILRLTYEC